MTQEDINRICEETNSVLRNLKITQCYHDLSVGLAKVIDPDNANWCTFATWASKTAGISIRDQALPKALLRFLKDEAQLRPKLGPVTLWIYQQTWSKVDFFEQARNTIRRVSEEVAEGNLRVFAELAPLFLRFTEIMARTEDQPGILRQFLADLKHGPTDHEGQELLRQAFSNYAMAANAIDIKAKAQLMLLANCQIGLHEQTRLQDDIQAAMDAPVVVVITDGLGRLLWIRLAFILLSPFGVSREHLRITFQNEWQRIATRSAMNLSLPGGRVLPLGRKTIPWPTHIPEMLQALDNSDLITLLQQYDDDLDILRTKGADNWSKLSDRMGFICALFRSSQQNADLFDQPFSQSAREEIMRGNIPANGI